MRSIRAASFGFAWITFSLAATADAAPATPPLTPPKTPTAVAKLPNIPKPPETYKPTPPAPARTIVTIAANDPRDILTIIRDNRKPGVVLQLPPKVYAVSPPAVNVGGEYPTVDDFTIETAGAAGSTVIDCGASPNHCLYLRGQRNALRGLEIRGDVEAHGSIRVDFATITGRFSARMRDARACDELSVYGSTLGMLDFVKCKRVALIGNQLRVRLGIEGETGEWDGIKFEEYAVIERNRITGQALSVIGRWDVVGGARLVGNRVLEGAKIYAFSYSTLQIEGNEVSDAALYGIRAGGGTGSRIAGNIVTSTGPGQSGDLGTAIDVLGSSPGIELVNNKIDAADRGIALTRASEARVYANSVTHAAQSGIHVVESRGVQLVHNTFSSRNYGAVFMKDSHDATLYNNAFFAPIAAAGELPTTFGSAGGNCAAYGNSLPPMPATGGGAGPTVGEQCRAIAGAPVNDKTVPGFPKTDVAGRPFPAKPVAGAYQ